MKKAAIVLCSLVVLAVPARAVAAPIVDGFWTTENGDGYFGNKTNSAPCCFFNSYSYGTGTATGALGFYNDGVGHLYMMFTQPLAVVDNSYGSGSVGWGKADGHTFSQLTGSDRSTIEVRDGSNALVWSAEVDYLTLNSKNNKYESLGLGGDGGIIKGDGTALMAYATSMQWNLAHSCYSKDATAYTAITTGGDSPNAGNNAQPATQPNGVGGDDGYGNIMNPCPSGKTSDPVAGYATPINWLFHVVYEVELDLSKISGGINGVYDVTVVHDSPAKAAAANQPCDDCTPDQQNNGAVPEPASLLLVGTGALGLASVIRRRRKQAQPDQPQA